MVQLTWAVLSYPRRHVWYFQLAVVLLQHFSVEKLPAGLCHGGWRPKDLRSFSCHRGFTWCGGSIWREEGFSIYQSLLMFLEEKEGLGEGAALWHIPWVLCFLTKRCHQTDQTDFLGFSLFKDPMMLEPGCWSAVSAGCWDFPWKIWKSWRNLCLRAWRNKKRKSQSKNIRVDMGSKKHCQCSKT